MKKQKTQSKIIVALTAVVLLLVALSATLTFAYFTAAKQATSNSMTFGKLGVAIADYDGTADLVVDGANESCTAANIVPGCTLVPAGEINIKNNIDSFIRFRFVVSVTGATGSGLTVADAQTMLLDSASGNMAVTLAAGTEDGLTFVKGTAGSGANTAYYYAFVPADSTFEGSLAFDLSRVSITLPRTLGNEYQGATFTLTLEVQAIQAEHLVDTQETPVAITAPTIANNVLTALGGLEGAAAWGAATIANNGAVNYFA